MTSGAALGLLEPACLVLFLAFADDMDGDGLGFGGRDGSPVLAEEVEFFQVLPRVFAPAGFRVEVLAGFVEEADSVVELHQHLLVGPLALRDFHEHVVEAADVVLGVHGVEAVEARVPEHPHQPSSHRHPSLLVVELEAGGEGQAVHASAQGQGGFVSQGLEAVGDFVPLPFQPLDVAQAVVDDVHGAVLQAPLGVGAGRVRVQGVAADPTRGLGLAED